MRIAALPLLLVGLALPTLADGDPPDVHDQWAQWRGPLGTGVAPRGSPPIEWSEEKNVRWKTAIPGRGLSTPVVWGNRIFLTTAIPRGETATTDARESPGAHHNVPSSRRHEFVVLAFDRHDGALLWERTVAGGLPHESTHVSGSWASSSAITDGKRLYAFFGSVGIFGLDLDGELLWKTDLGDMRIKHGHGEGSSPALHGETLIVNWDHEGDSFLVALDTSSGKERWRVARDEATSWSTPLIVEHRGKVQVIASATRRVRSYDLADGKLLWECGGLSGNVVASPVASDGIVYVANSYETRAMLAIRLDAAKGDVTGTDAVVWTRTRDTPYVPSPLLYRDVLCFLKHYQALLTCVDAPTGKTLFGPERLPEIGDVYASPVGADGRIYVAGRSGATLVLAHGPEFRPLALNRLDDSFSASPAIVGDALYLRGERRLYCIADEKPN